MGESQQSRQADFVLGARAGACAAYAVTSAASAVNLALVDNQAGDSPGSGIVSADQLGVGVQGCYVTFVADGADVYYILGPSQASVSSGNAPVIATTGVNAAGVCQKFPANIPVPLLVTSADQWIGLISATGTTPTLRVNRSSPYPQAA